MRNIISELSKNPLKHVYVTRKNFSKTKFDKNDLDLFKCYTRKIPQKCYTQKMYILYEVLYEGDSLLNKKTEFIFKCTHQNKFMLLHHDSKD